MALETRSSTLSLLLRKKNYRTKNKIIYFWCLLRLDLLAHFPLFLGSSWINRPKWIFFIIHFCLLKLAPLAHYPLYLGSSWINRPKWIFSIIHFCLLKLAPLAHYPLYLGSWWINRPKWIFFIIHFCLMKIINLFWPLRILISYSLQNAKYVYSSHKPVSATLGSYPSYWEQTRGLRLKPFFQPENIALYNW